MRLGEIVATLPTLVVTGAYALITGFGVPVERALLMTAVFLTARLLARDRNMLNALGAAALAVLVWSPRALFEASFQMTFLAVVAIAGIAVPLGERSFLPHARTARRLRDRWRDAAMPPRLAQERVMLRLWGEALAGVFGRWAYGLPSLLVRCVLWAAELALIGVVAEAVMALPMAMYFHRATAFALPANMLSVPVVALLAPLGLLTFLSSLLSSWLAAVPGAALALLLHAVTGAVRRLSHAQAADIRVPGPTLVHVLITLAVLAVCCWAVRRSRALAIAAIVMLPLVPIGALWPSAPMMHPGRLEVTAIDVGQGDSLLVAGPTGRTMVIDAGGPTGAAANAENAAGSSSFDIGEEVVSPYLWSRQMRRIDVLVLTHAHSDHMGGMPAVLRNFRPRELWVGVDPASARYRELLMEAASLGVRVRHLRAGDHIDWDSVSVDVLAPSRAYANPGPPVNDDSLVLRLQLGKASALLEGDAQAASEEAMVVRARSGDAHARIGPDTLLKVGHHGSRTSTTPEFVALAAPEDAVISVGANNTFGHPRTEVIDRLTAAHARVYRTDRDGLTTFLLSPDGRIAAAISASNPE
jgi:competence protein ComEC